MADAFLQSSDPASFGIFNPSQGSLSNNASMNDEVHPRFDYSFANGELRGLVRPAPSTEAACRDVLAYLDRMYTAIGSRLRSYIADTNKPATRSSRIKNELKAYFCSETPPHGLSQGDYSYASPSPGSYLSLLVLFKATSDGSISKQHSHTAPSPSAGRLADRITLAIGYPLTKPDPVKIAGCSLDENRGILLAPTALSHPRLTDCFERLFKHISDGGGLTEEDLAASPWSPSFPELDTDLSQHGLATLTRFAPRDYVEGRFRRERKPTTVPPAMTKWYISEPTVDTPGSIFKVTDDGPWQRSSDDEIWVAAYTHAFQQQDERSGQAVQSQLMYPDLAFNSIHGLFSTSNMQSLIADFGHAPPPNMLAPSDALPVYALPEHPGGGMEGMNSLADSNAAFSMPQSTVDVIAPSQRYLQPIYSHPNSLLRPYGTPEAAVCGLMGHQYPADHDTATWLNITPADGMPYAAHTTGEYSTPAMFLTHTAAGAGPSDQEDDLYCHNDAQWEA